MILNRIYYTIKPIIPRRLQIVFRRQLVAYKRRQYSHIWPIDPSSAKLPEGWSGWPEQKKFALVLTHDVETSKGCNQCNLLMEIEKSLGFISSFNFVPERYEVPMQLLDSLWKDKFEVGVHGLLHDGKLYSSKECFEERADRINQYINKWGSVGFRSPSMHCNLEWIKKLNIEYDCSTFDTDPFEPQPNGTSTIFPFWVKRLDSKDGYCELPYTLPQDFTLFILMKEKNIEIWKEKLAWIVEKGGMALLNTHPDYMSFNGRTKNMEEYIVKYYNDFLGYIKNKYEGMYWHALPREISAFYKKFVTKTN